jgi:hypothetical protein
VPKKPLFLLGALFLAAAVFALPDWITKPAGVYPRASYLTGLGSASSMRKAEAAAYASLSAFFGQSVDSDYHVTETYSENYAGDGIEGATRTRQSINTSASLNRLAGAEIRERYEDPASGTCYALAVLGIPGAIKTYSLYIMRNNSLIQKAVASVSVSGFAIGDVARYRYAAMLAGDNAVYSNIVALLGAEPPKSGLLSADEYRGKAAEAARAIPIYMRVTGDSDGSIKDAFAQALNADGFVTGMDPGRYILSAKFSLTPAEFKNSVRKFTRYEVSATLLDTKDGSALFPWSAKGREGHITQDEADQSALRACVSQILGTGRGKTPESFAATLDAYLTQPAP